MADRYPSIYQRARKDACLTQEQAAELADDYRRLMEIAEDGRIDEWEAPEFEQISENIQRVIAAGFEVLYAEAPPGIKKDRPAAGTAENR